MFKSIRTNKECLNLSVQTMKLWTNNKNIWACSVWPDDASNEAQHQQSSIYILYAHFQPSVQAMKSWPNYWHMCMFKSLRTNNEVMNEYIWMCTIWPHVNASNEAPHQQFWKSYMHVKAVNQSVRVRAVHIEAVQRRSRRPELSILKSSSPQCNSIQQGKHWSCATRYGRCHYAPLRFRHFELGSITLS